MLKGRLGLITGGGSGIGRAACKVFSEEGARVIIADINIEGCEKTLNVILLINNMVYLNPSSLIFFVL